MARARGERWSGALVARIVQAVGRWIGRRRYAALAPLARRLLWLGQGRLSRRRRIVQRNLELCFPDMPVDERAALLQATMHSNAQGLLEAMYAWHAERLRVDEIAVVEGLEHLQAAFAQGRGVVLLSGHSPCTELAMRVLVERTGHSIQPMVRHFATPWLDDMIDGARTRHLGGTVDRADAQAFCRVVREGRGVFYAPDVDVKRRNVFLPFFGVPASTLDAMHVLLRRAGGVVVPVWIHRGGDGRMRIRVEAPWPDFPSRDGSADAARYLAWVEAHVRRNPADYQWFAKRFKTRPAGEADLYRR